MSAAEEDAARAAEAGPPPKEPENEIPCKVYVQTMANRYREPIVFEVSPEHTVDSFRNQLDNHGETCKHNGLYSLIWNDVPIPFGEEGDKLLRDYGMELRDAKFLMVPLGKWNSHARFTCNNKDRDMGPTLDNESKRRAAFNV